LGLSKKGPRKKKKPRKETRGKEESAHEKVRFHHYLPPKGGNGDLEFFPGNKSKKGDTLQEVGRKKKKEKKV